MSTRTVITCDRCQQEAKKDPKCVDLPIVSGRSKSPKSPGQDDEFDLCKDCFYLLGDVLRDFLNNATLKTDREERP